MARRVSPPPAIGRKPQTGLRLRPDGRRPPILGARLSYLVSLVRKEGLEALRALADREHQLLQLGLSARPQVRRVGSQGIFTPNPLTASLRLRPDTDLRVRLPAIGRFNPSQPAVAVAIEFLGSTDDLPELGAIAVTRAGDIIIAWVSLDELPRLSAHPATVRLEALRAISAPNVDPQGHANTRGTRRNRLAEDPRTAEAATGKGVRLAVVDNGFDYMSPAFLQGAAPQVRALLLHDLTLEPPAGAPAGTLGQRFLRDELQASLEWYETNPAGTEPAPVAKHLARLDSPDPDIRTLLWRHGTAVTGIAAGNGRGDGSVPPTVGPAPDADLMLYAIGMHDEQRFANLTEVHVAFDTAFTDAAGAPCVALLADSDNLGPHDGSLDGELFLDELLLEPGRAIVLTAGNQNHTDPPTPDSVTPLHAMIEPGAATVPLQLRFDSGATWAVSAEVWFQSATAPEAKITARIRGVGFGPVTVTDSPPPLDPSAPPAWTTVLDPAQNSDGTKVEALLQYDPEADAYGLRLIFRPVTRPDIAPSEWTIEVTGDGPVHGWIDRNGNGLAQWEGAAAQAGADRTTFGSPSGAARCFTIGSVVRSGNEATPSNFSGRGPVRTPPERPQRKPDFVAKGEDVRAPFGWPAQRVLHEPPPGGDYGDFHQGTSYAAPQVAGFIAQLFEQFGPSDPLLGSAATWADIRQALLQAAVRLPGMPQPEPDGWDPACGYGLIDPQAQSAPQPAALDLWMAKTPADRAGAEPFVAWRFWDSPDLTLLDAEDRPLDPVAVATGDAEPAQIRVHVRNRGAQRVKDITVALWWAPLGALYPLPQIGHEAGGAWRTEGLGGSGQHASGANMARVSCIEAHEAAEVTLQWKPPRDEAGRVRPHQLLAAVHADDDPYSPDQLICATNNVAVLTVAAVRRGQPPLPFTLLGTDDTDGAVLWREDGQGSLRIENLPVTAIPWREAAIFQSTGRRNRPLHGDPAAGDDPALGHEANLEGRRIETVTDVQGGRRLVLQRDRVTIEGSGPKLILPRLRLARGATLEIHAGAMETGVAGAIHLLHLSGGRRVGGGTIHQS